LAVSMITPFSFLPCRKLTTVETCSLCVGYWLGTPVALVKRSNHSTYIRVAAWSTNRHKISTWWTWPRIKISKRYFEVLLCE
jgi:hypothetical protein